MQFHRRGCLLLTVVAALIVPACGGDPAQTTGGQGGVTGGQGGVTGSANGSGGHGGEGVAGAGGGGGADSLVTCNAGPPTGDVLDPGEVYILGHIDKFGSDDFGIMHWISPTSVAAGFRDIDTQDPWIRPTDGRLLYLQFKNVGVTREFRCDACPYDGQFPDAPTENDVELPLICPKEFGKVSFALDFLVSPTGRVLQLCSTGPFNTWYDLDGTVVYSDPEDRPVHLGYGDLMLTETRVVHLPSGMASPIVGLPSTTVFTVRAAAPDKFLLVMHVEGAEGYDGVQDLWEVAADGSAERIGAFPPLPAGAMSIGAGSSKLDACGGLLQTGFGVSQINDVIVRRDLSGTSQVVYTDKSDPLVKIGFYALFTGP